MAHLQTQVLILLEGAAKLLTAFSLSLQPMEAGEEEEENKKLQLLDIPSPEKLGEGEIGPGKEHDNSMEEMKLLLCNSIQGL